VPVGALPARGQVSADVPAQPALPTPSDDLDPLAARSELASTALSELRGLYEPTFAPAAPAPSGADGGGLARRTPRAAPSAAAAATPARPSRHRSANEVRGMLAGFRAGVERGRAPQSEPTDDPTS
jgi:hypothetical protein